MKKSRWITILAAGVVLAGLGMGVTAYLSAPGTNAQASILPDAATWMPASATFVAYLDLASLAASSLREEWESSPHRQKDLDEIDEFREKTGLDPWTDFRALAISTQKSDEGREWGLALIGDFDPERILAVVEEHAKVERQAHGETTLYVFESSKTDRPEIHALAFPSPSTALFGPPEYVRTMLEVGAGEEASAAEGPLTAWLDELPLNETFWCVGSPEDGLHRVMTQRNVEASHLPPIESFAVSGNLDVDFSMTARGRASDAESAQKLADVVRGFVELGSLQQQSRPEIQAVLDSVQIQILENTVEVSLAVPYETLRRLVHPKPKEADQ